MLPGQPWDEPEMSSQAPFNKQERAIRHDSPYISVLCAFRDSKRDAASLKMPACLCAHVQPEQRWSP